MAILTDVLGAVVDMMEDEALGLYANVVIGPLPPDNGIAVAYSSGAPVGTDFNKGMAWEMDLTLNAKHSDQETALSTLADIHAALTRTKIYPRTEQYQITNIETISGPSYLDREENTAAQWLYGSALRVKFFYFGGN